MKDAKTYWEERGKQYQSDIRGVLFKWPYPSFVNTLFHKWSYGQVSKNVLNNTKFKALDIACGWGRISTELLKKNTKIKVDGIDLSETYVDIFNKRLLPRGKAIVCDMQKMPYKNSIFDLTFIVASFMYLSDISKQRRALSEIFRTLKKDGTIVLIEQTPLMGLFEVSKLFKRRKAAKQGFTSSFINDLITSNKGVFKSISYWPIKYFPLYISYTIKKS